MNINFNQILEKNSIVSDQLSLDNPLRISKSYWERFCNHQKFKDLDNKLQEQVLSFFQERYHFTDQKSFKKVWNRLETKLWTPKDELTAGTLRRIDTKLKESLTYHGEGIHFPKDLSNSSTIKQLTQALLHGSPVTLDLMKKRNIQAILISTDKELLNQFRNELQREIENLSQKLPKTPQEEIVWRAFLGNIIAILPFSYPRTGEKIILPILENGICRKTTYTIEVIPLKYNDNFTPMPALGLIPENDPTAPPILSFIGTTYPAGEGFTASLLADFSPGYSVGEIIYKRNEQLIDKWLENKRNAHLIGMSLGGAMAFHALRHHHEISRVDAYSPPGLSKNNWVNGIGSTCNVNIYCQPGDIVTHIGNWPIGETVSLYTIIPHHKNLPNHLFSAHARIFTGCDKITILKENPEEANKYLGRSILTKIHNILGPLLIFFPIKLISFLRSLILKIHGVATNIFKKSE